MSRIEESLYRVSGIYLNEARNLENENFNSIIRTILRMGYISQRSINKLNRLGYTADDTSIVAPNGNYLELEDVYSRAADDYVPMIIAYDKDDNEFFHTSYYGVTNKKDIDFKNLLDSHTTKKDDEVVDDISDFANAKMIYNNEKSKLDDMYSEVKDTQLNRIQARRKGAYSPGPSEFAIANQHKRIKKAKENKDSILKKHGINPRESLDNNYKKKD